MHAPGSPAAPPAGRAVPRIAVRTALLVACILLLFPRLLDILDGGAWSRFVLAMGAWRWAAWGACFVAMTLTRFAGGPRRDARDIPPDRHDHDS